MRYGFRRELESPNYPQKFTYEQPNGDELSLSYGIACSDIDTFSPTVKNAFLHLCGFVRAVSEETDGEKVNIVLSLDGAGLVEYAGYKGRAVEITRDRVFISASDERGLAQALYDLEDEMTSRRAPFLKLGKRYNKPLFSPRMAHSAYGFDKFPNGYLQNLAKEGFDAILVYVKGVNMGAVGEYDFNDLIERASNFGIDVYAYSVINNFNSPYAPDAEKIYSDIYGPIFKEHAFKGVVLVGESVEFPSIDPHTTGRHYYEKPKDNVSNWGKKSPGWWPCCDYPDWLELVKKSIRRERPDADIVFWTYNWGYAPKEDRLALIDALPTDISLLVTFEMFEKYEVRGITESVADYSIVFEGPGGYFLSEAEAAKRRGIRLYSQANSAGRTWDFGTVPYIPAPQQWQRRYAAMRECAEKYGLCGVMESHHYGVTPSFITRLEKRSFDIKEMPKDEALLSVAEKLCEGDTDKCIEGFECFSEAIRLLPPTNEEQYGVFRIGSAYPLCFNKRFTPPPGDTVGKKNGYSIVNFGYKIYDDGQSTLHSKRIRAELGMLEDAKKLMKKGIAILKNVNGASEELKRIINFAEYIVCAIETDINVKKMFIIQHKLCIADSMEKILSLIKSAKRLVDAEEKTTKRCIKFTERDSFLGYEATMGYVGDRECLEWKLLQLKYVKEIELPSAVEWAYN